MNKFQFMGRLTKDPEVRNTTNGTVVSAFPLAVNRKFADQNGERQADFFNVSAFGKTAEFCNKYFKKGQQVLVEGRIQNRTWDDQTGTKRYSTDYIIESAYFADSKRDNNNNNNNNNEVPNDADFITIDDTAELPF
ncbi:MAG: single-stranded DNA-binding protein [Clostridia bacterium]